MQTTQFFLFPSQIALIEVLSRGTHRHADAGGANVCSTPLDRHFERKSQMGLPDAARNTPHTVFTQYESTQKSIRRYKANIYPTLQRQVLPVFTYIPLTTYFQHSMADPFWGACPALALPANARCQSDWHCSVPQTGIAGQQFWVAGFLGSHTEQQTMAGQLGGGANRNRCSNRAPQILQGYPFVQLIAHGWISLLEKGIPGLLALPASTHNQRRYKSHL
jgi:hypothetical protein